MMDLLEIEYLIRFFVAFLKWNFNNIAKRRRRRRRIKIFLCHWFHAQSLWCRILRYTSNKNLNNFFMSFRDLLFCLHNSCWKLKSWKNWIQEMMVVQIKVEWLFGIFVFQLMILSLSVKCIFFMQIICMLYFSSINHKNLQTENIIRGKCCVCLFKKIFTYKNFLPPRSEEKNYNKNV